jgi:hypothetical protein
MKYKVYIAKLKRKGTFPTCVLKVGITAFNDAMDRLTYRGDDEPFPICEAFSDIKIMKAKWFPNRDAAEKAELFIMNSIKGNDKYFHNWRETDKLSGITEMRIWNYEEFLQCINLLENFS